MTRTTASASTITVTTSATTATSTTAPTTTSITTTPPELLNHTDQGSQQIGKYFY